ncbi:MAG TPA: hypothetical protein VIM73_11140, partial [Polyangiaceae bacterium]
MSRMRPELVIATLLGASLYTTLGAAQAPAAPAEPPALAEPPAPAEPPALQTSAPAEAPVEPAPSRNEPVEVTVVGTRVAQTPGSAHLVNRKQLERFEYDDPHAVLQQVPGVYVRT